MLFKAWLGHVLHPFAFVDLLPCVFDLGGGEFRLSAKRHAALFGFLHSGAGAPVSVASSSLPYPAHRRHAPGKHFLPGQSLLGLINQKNGLFHAPSETLGISGLQTTYRFQNC
jgi:hypothetical protein